MQKPRTIGGYVAVSARPRERNPSMERLRNSKQWRRAAKAFLSRNPLCVFCDQAGRLTAAQCVDHIIPWRGDTELFWDSGNWQALCNHCHGQKNVAELETTRERVEGRWIVTGKRGAGKSTWVTEHARPDDVVWDLDAEAKRRGFGEYPRTDGQMRVLYALRDQLVDCLEGNTDGCYIIVHDRLRATLYAQRLGARVVVIDCGEDERRSRLVSRDGKLGDEKDVVGGWQSVH